ncbi:MAG TPA: hypothetical protein VGG76_04800, partial [Gemmatimonadaceae bacterium]
MHLIGRKAVVLLAVAFVACSDSTAPPVHSTGFFLSDINGRPLPTYVVPTDPTTTVLLGSLTLDGIGHATMVEERRQQSGTPLVLTTAYNYLINGNDVTFTFQVPCPINA